VVLIPHLEIPVDPDAPEARRWVVEELSKPEYASAQPTAFDLAMQAIRDWIASLFEGATGVPGPLLALLAVLVVAALLVVALGVESALWSVDPGLTIGRVFTVAVLFLAAFALALGSLDARTAARRVFAGVLAGCAAVALASLVVLVVWHDDAVLKATTGAGWRFRGLGENPNTVSMLLSIGLPIAVWHALDRRGPELLASGTRVGGFVIEAVLGRGGMGTVWLATDRVLERRVALKELTFSIDLTAEERAVLRERTMR